METDMTPLKAVVEPILTKARRAAMVLVAATAFTGIEVLSLIYCNVNAVLVLSDYSYYLAQLAPPWYTFVSRKGPADARG